MISVWGDLSSMPLRLFLLRQFNYADDKPWLCGECMLVFYVAAVTQVLSFSLSQSDTIGNVWRRPIFTSICPLHEIFTKRTYKIISNSISDWTSGRYQWLQTLHVTRRRWAPLSTEAYQLVYYKIRSIITEMNWNEWKSFTKMCAYVCYIDCIIIARQQPVCARWWEIKPLWHF